MQFNITVIKTTIENKGKYNQLEVAYTNHSSGKVESKKLMSFVYEATYKAIADAKMDSQFTITSEKEAGKDGKEYWQWKGAQAIAPGAASASPTTGVQSSTGRVTSSTYATAEERAKTQVYIVKQSALKSAVDLLSINAKIPPSTSLILAQAQEFVDWVFEDNREHGVSLVDIPDDIISVD